MADDTHDDADEPVIPGPEGELALDADEDTGGASETGGPVAADASVSVAPFIDDDDDDNPSDDGSSDESSDDQAAEEQPAKGKTRASKSAVGTAVATASSAKAGKGSAAKQGAADKQKAAEVDEVDEVAPKVTRRVVTSKRVTPKGGASQKPSGPKKAKGQQHDEDEGFRSSRYTPPGGQGAYAEGPSPWWVPTLLFGFLIIGALIIMLNYMGVFGDAQNLRLVIGLGFILAGILTSTQYR